MVELITFFNSPGLPFFLVANHNEYFVVITAIIDDGSECAIANLNIKDSRGESPLSLALNSGMQHLVIDLIQGKTPLNPLNIFTKYKEDKINIHLLC